MNVNREGDHLGEGNRGTEISDWGERILGEERA